jgi:Putative adhesin
MATYVRQQQITHRIGTSGRLQIKVTDADVRIRPADGDEVRINASFEIAAGSDEEADRVLEAAKLVVSSGGSYLDVRSNEEGDLGATIGQWITGEPGGLGSAIRHWVTGRPRVELSLEVEAPRGCELRIEAVSGDLVVEGMAGEQRYSTVSGDQYLTDLSGSVRVGTVSGDATLRAASAIRLRAETVSGDLSVIAPRLEELRASTVSGDLEIEGEPAADGEHRIESVSGDLLFGLVGNATFDVRGIATDIHADMPHRVEGRMDRRRVVIGSGGPTVIFSSMSGDIAVRHPRRAAERRPEAAASAETAGEEPASSASLEVLRALERGEIDVEEASRRLAEGSTDA